VDNVQSDLAKYSAADAFIASEGFLDEDKLKLKIKIMKANQQLLHDSARAVATLAHSQPIPGIYELLQNAQRTFIKMAESMQQDIDKLHKQIQKLNEFDRQTKNLFATSLEEMQLAMQGILVLNETTVKSNGLYTLPSGVDKSYFTEIKKDTKNEVTDKQLLAGCTILYVHDKKNGFNYYMLEKDGYSYRIDEKKLSGNLASLVKKYGLDVVELTSKELTTRVNNQQKKGYNYFEKDDRVLGLGLLSKGQGVMDEIQESGVWDSLWMLGLSTAAIRSTQTFSKETGSTGNVLKGSKNGQAYTLDRNKSAGNAVYKKVSGAKSVITPEMEEKILWGQRKNPTKNEIIGGHSSSINNNHPNFATETIKINPDGTKDIKIVTQFPDGNLSKIKNSTVFPNGWSDTKILDSIKNVGNSPTISVRGRDGATWHRTIVDGVEIDVIKLGDNIVSGYPTGKVNAPIPGGFTK
ncbi:hypothetical protein EZ049_00005, partial [Enterococcus faecalis]|uniref:EndoU domain-containing protein n=1 Tax=Enterococcus faecalis TaxID=1351 RepID=UPI0012E1553B